MLLTTLTLAGPPKTDEAEHRRLQNDTASFLERNAWVGVDRAYRQMSQLKRVELTFEDHWNGGLAAKNVGSIVDAYHRFELAAAVDPNNMDLLVELATIYANYGRVHLRVSKKLRGSFVLEAKDVGFDPTPRQAIDRARKELAESGEYFGVLPLGRYVLEDRPFDIIGDDAIIEITAR